MSGYPRTGSRTRRTETRGRAPSLYPRRSRSCRFPGSCSSQPAGAESSSPRKPGQRLSRRPRGDMGVGRWVGRRVGGWVGVRAHPRRHLDRLLALSDEHRDVGRLAVQLLNLDTETDTGTDTDADTSRADTSEMEKASTRKTLAREADSGALILPSPRLLVVPQGVRVLAQVRVGRGPAEIRLRTRIIK